MKFMERLLTGTLVLSVAVAATAAEDGPVPEKALKELKYRVGKWKSTGFMNGVEQTNPGSETTKWCPG